LKTELFAIGLVSILGQVVILRELNVAFFGIELVYILAIGSWLLGTTAGAMSFAQRLRPPRIGVKALLLAAALLVPAEVVFLRGHRLLFGGVAGAYLSYGYQLAALLLATFPVGLVLGLLFQWAAKRYCGLTGSLGRAYAIESLGGLAGGVVSFLALTFSVSNFAAALICGLAAAAAAGFVRRTRGALLATVPVLCLLALGLWFSPLLDHRLTALNHPSLVSSLDTPYGRITVCREGGQVTVFKDDVYIYESEETAAEELVHLAALQVAEPARILVIGGGVFGLVREAARYHPQALDSFEIDGRMAQFIRGFLVSDEASEPVTVRPNVMTGDPRQLFRQSGRYDLIIVGIPDPDSGQDNRFFTREFFHLAREHLTQHGVLAFRLGSTPNVFTQARLARDGSIGRALANVFPHTVALPASATILLGGLQPVDRNPSQLETRWRSRNLETRLVSAPYINYLFSGDRFPELNRQLFEAGVTPNRDLVPVCFRYSTWIWLSMIFPSLTNRVPSGPGTTAWAVLGLIALAATGLAWRLARGARRLKATLFMTLAAAAGMLLETLLLLHYETRHGVLYRDLGLLLMMFMIGLAIGAGGLSSWLRKQPKVSRRWGIALSAGLLLLSLAYFLSLRMAAGASLGWVALQLLGAGLVVSGVFTYCSRMGAQDERSVVSPLYAADLLGGFAATLIGSLLLLPFLGFALSGWVVVGIALATLLFI